jgi:NADP-dependent 3-hydroxy acid dehydrogenase YdfG
MAALRHMRPVGRGTIIKIGSALADRGIPLQSADCGAEHAIRGFTNALHRAAAREEQRSIDHGRIARRQYAAVRLGTHPYAAAAASGRAAGASSTRPRGSSAALPEAACWTPAQNGDHMMAIR